MKKYFLLLGLFTITSAFAQVKLSKVNMGHTYTISIPNNMVKTYNFGNHQVLQYKNDTKEIYLVVLEESKDELREKEIACNNIDDYYEIMTQNYKTEFTNYLEIKKAKTKSNGYNILQTEYQYTVSDSTNEVNLYFFQDYIDTKDYYYKVVFWTRSENAEEWRKFATEISKSFKED